VKDIYFLSGLPRSGSTVLAAILSQHPSLHASSTSGLLDMLIGTLRAWADSLNTKAQKDQEAAEEEIQRVLRNICETKYADIQKPVILDKARGWANDTNIRTMAKVFGHKPKIIATVRKVEDCAASFVRICKPENLDKFLVEDELINHLKESYQTLEKGFTFAPECFLIVDYDDLMNDPQKELNRIHEFLNLPDYEYDFDSIDGTNLQERDEEIWLVPGLHDVKPKLGYQHKQDSKDILKHRYFDFVQPRFWLGEKSADKPIHDLDIQLAAGLMGNFKEGLQLANKLEKEEPWNNRAAFNRGWYRMYEGKLLEGENLLLRGRLEKVFGNEPPKSPMPMWDGVSKGTVLLNLEGGLGDQIHGVRYARDIARIAGKVIVACSGQLATIFRDVEGVVAVCQTDAVYGVVHDYWVPSMSTIPILKYEYKDIDGSSYINKPMVEPHKGLRIGLRWQGNPQFEHEQHRLFPSSKLFDSLDDVDAEFISLQRDEGSQYKPYWVKQVPLNHWEETRFAIANCDLIITSCTSVAHLAGSMGIPTWIVVPILPYYLWAPPGNTTVWYDSVKLYRQEVFGDWSAPFNQIKNDLKNFKIGDNYAN
jgi:hypothetical protein